MRITLFGSTGNVGQLFIEKALRDGHEVVAYARSPKKIQLTHERLTILPGELTDAVSIDAAVSGSDAVVSVMGPNGYQDALIFAPAYRLIIAAMKAHHVKRLIALGTPTIRDSSDRFNPIFEALILIVRLIIRKGSEDIATVGTLVRDSGLDYTLVRIPLLYVGESAPVRVGAFGNGIWWPFVSRESFTDFLIAQLTDTHYVRRVIAIANQGTVKSV